MPSGEGVSILEIENRCFPSDLISTILFLLFVLLVAYAFCFHYKHDAQGSDACCTNDTILQATIASFPVLSEYGTHLV